jgi:cytochrome c oxidase cbb3-type subunit 2
MNSFTTFRSFFGFIFFIFLFTWIALVVFPWLELGHLSPIIDDDNVTVTPWDSSGAAHAGEKVYAANGCVYCHTQQVRAATSGTDIIRGWGTAASQDDPKDPKKDVTRRSYPRDYIWQGQVFLGTSRDGADLSNVAELPLRSLRRERPQQHAGVSLSFRHAKDQRPALRRRARFAG